MIHMFKIHMFKLRTVRSRLLALMTLVVIPIAVLSLVLATINYNSASKEISTTQLQTVSNFAVRARIVFRGSLRLILSTVAATEATSISDADCDATAKKTLNYITRHPAVWVKFENGKTCSSYTDNGLDDSVMEKIAAKQSKSIFVKTWVGLDLANARYDSITIDKKLYIVIYAQNLPDMPSKWEGVMLMDPVLLQSSFELGSVLKGTIVSIMKSGNEPIITRNVEQNDISWLPRIENINREPTSWLSQSKSGGEYIYANQLIADPDLYVQLRFDGQALRAAWWQFIILVFTPILILTLLVLTYAKAIQKTVIKWIADIESASKSHGLEDGQQKFATINDTMPEDMKSVAVAFNTMVSDNRKREQDLRSALENNTVLMRELHHRVKNSLQVIQSYIGLSRRSSKMLDQSQFIDVEAKVQVLSTAYRFALTESGMKPVAIHLFLKEIIENLSATIRKSDQWVSSNIETDAALSVDRLIPLGLAIVEAMSAGLKSERATNVKISVVALKDHDVTLNVTTDGKIVDDAIDKKIIRGLALQLEAQVLEKSDKDILNWQFRP